MLFIGNPSGRSIMISNCTFASCASICCNKFALLQCVAMYSDRDEGEGRRIQEENKNLNLRQRSHSELWSRFDTVVF